MTTNRNEQRIHRRVGWHVRGRMAAGLALLVPIVITYFVIHFALNFLTQLVDPLISRLPQWVHAGQWISYVPAISSIIIILLLLYVTGLLAENFVGRRVVLFLQEISRRIPILREIYDTANDATSLFSGGSARQFTRVVLAPFPSKDTKSLGFVTGSFVGPDNQQYVMVYLPTTPTPMSGYLLFCTEDQIEDAGISVDEAIRIVITGGLSRGNKKNGNTSVPEGQSTKRPATESGNR